mgnify:CR=1 FL=1
MLQNLKVDIIYHLTNSDFEMEFNLCGCCRMRLLSDKTADRKSLVSALSRAVSRSRIIIACGPLFSAEGLISTVATAIGSSTVAVNNAAYGINGSDTIQIINGATPLVTADGYFGGCIIESGPQTIILLTENKALRKSLMQTLIHPYIEEMSMLPVKEKAVAQEIPEQKDELIEEEPQVTEESAESDTPEAEEIYEEEETTAQAFVPATVEILEDTDSEETDDNEALETEAQEESKELTESDEIAETEETTVEEETTEETETVEDDKTSEETKEAELEPETEANEEEKNDGAPTLEYIAEADTVGEREIPFVFDETEQKQMQELSDKMSEAYDTMYIKPERVKHSRTDKYAASYTPTEENDSFLSDAEYVSYKKSAKRKNLNIPIIILAVILLAIIGVLCYFMFLQPRLQGVDTMEYLREIFDTVNETVYV